MHLAKYHGMYPERQDHNNPLLEPDSLCRLAWSVYFYSLVQDTGLKQSTTSLRYPFHATEHVSFKAWKSEATIPSDISNLSDIPDTTNAQMILISDYEVIWHIQPRCAIGFEGIA
jgi:hypothetical protein